MGSNKAKRDQHTFQVGDPVLFSVYETGGVLASTHCTLAEAMRWVKNHKDEASFAIKLPSGKWYKKKENWKPYTIKVVDRRCKHCKHGCTWAILAPDGALLSKFYTVQVQAEAEWVAKQLNDAFKVGTRCAIPVE